jgi:hypothetical protein
MKSNFLPRLAVGLTNQEGESNVVDNCGNTHNFMSNGAGDRSYDGRFHSHSAGNCRCRRSDQNHLGTENIVDVRIPGPEGKVFGNGGGRRSGKILSRLFMLSGETVS